MALADEALHPDQPEADDILKVCSDLRDDAGNVLEPFWDAIDDELAFCLDLDHYLSPEGNTRDRTRLQPRTLELFHDVRHKASQIANAEIYVDCRPVDDYGDNETAEWAKFALEKELFDPLKRYKVRRREMVWAGIAARQWGMAADWDERCKSIFFRTVDPTVCYKPPGWNDIHDPTCPWFGEDVVMRLGDARRTGREQKWENVDDLRPDAQMSADARIKRGTRAEMNSSGGVRFTRSSTPVAASSSQDAVTICKWWFRYDPEGATETGDEENVYDLAPEDEFARCTACDHEEFSPEALQPYRTDTGGMPDNLDEMMSCPNCGQPMERVSQLGEQPVYEKYPKGRLVIFAPHCNVLLYDGEWPFPTRSYPYMFYGPYDHIHPRKPYGPSETSLNWSLQMVSNAMLRFGYEQMARNVDIIMTPLGGLVTAKREPFRFTDQHGQIAYFSNPLAAQYTKHFQGSGLPPAWAVFQQTISNAFRANIGSNDIGLGPEQSKDIPVGTVDRLVQQGELPVVDAIQALQEEEGVFFGCVLDMVIGGAWDEKKWVRTIGSDGAWVMKQLQGAALPQMDVFVTSSPQLRAISKDQQDAFMAWAQAPPPMRRVLAKLNNIPPSLLYMYEQDEAKFRDQQQQEMLDAAGGDGGGGLGPPSPAALAQPNGAVLPPAIAARMAGPRGNGVMP